MLVVQVVRAELALLQPEIQVLQAQQLAVADYQLVVLAQVLL
jgi:hypothetical protein